MNAQYLHVSQFYQAILCFSILILIVQKIIILVKDLNGQYLKSRTTQFDDEVIWKKSFQTQKQLQQVQKQKQMDVKQQQQMSQPKDQTLRTSFIINNQSKQTQRNLIQGQQLPKRMSQQKKIFVQFQNTDKSISGIAIEQQNAQSMKSKETTNEKSNNKETQQPAKIQSKSSLNLGIQNSGTNQVQIDLRQQKKGQFYNKSKRIDQTQGAQIDPQLKAKQLTQEDALQKEYKDKQKIRYFKRIDSLFNEYFSIVIPVLILGILVHSTYIFTMVCFFGFIFCSLLFNYANLLSKLKSKHSEDSIFTKTNKLISGIFIIALFISYWSDNEFV